MRKKEIKMGPRPWIFEKKEEALLVKNEATAMPHLPDG